MLVQRLVMCSLVLVMVGCASGVKHSAQSDKQYLTTQPAKSISLSLNDQAKAKLTDNLKFDQNALLDNVKRALVGKNLLNEAKPDATHKIEILVTDLRVRSNFSAIMFGFMAGSDSITGDVILKDSTGKELNRFEVSASYALGGLAGGQDSSRMSWLYEKFAQLAVENLTGNTESTK